MNEFMNDFHLKALLDQIRTTFKYKDDPSIICSKSRKTCEYILILIWNREFNEYPTGKMIQALVDGIIKKRPSLIPLGIQKLIGTIQIYGNTTSHAQANFEELDATHAIIIEAAIGKLCNWFFIDYLNTNPVPDFNTTNESGNAQETSYRELLSSIFSDGILELEEYEMIIAARESLRLENSQYEKIEEQVLKNFTNRSIENIVELLKPSDLKSIKIKEEGKIRSYPNWINLAINEIISKKNTHLVSLLSEYFNQLQNNNSNEIPLCVKFLGCWQGWYLQSLETQMKTFYNFTLVSLSQSEFLGLSFELLNPEWGNVPQISSDLLKAIIHGTIQNDYVINFQKEYLIENSWHIGYQAVITEEGKYFEGDWEIGKYNLSGPFNAIKTRSHPPIHIFDTDLNKPVAKSKDFDKFRNLTSTWFFQITGKIRFYGLIHIVEIDNEVHANILYAEDEKFNLSYLYGNYDGLGSVLLKKENDILGKTEDMLIRFNVDWSINELNGTVKDEINKIRSLKAFKL